MIKTHTLRILMIISKSLYLLIHQHLSTHSPMSEQWIHMNFIHSLAILFYSLQIFCLIRTSPLPGLTVLLGLILRLSCQWLPLCLLPPKCSTHGPPKIHHSLSQIWLPRLTKISSFFPSGRNFRNLASELCLHPAFKSSISNNGKTSSLLCSECSW